MNLVVDSTTGREEERVRALHLISDVATEGAMLEALERYEQLPSVIATLLPLCRSPATLATLAVFRLFRLLAETSSVISRTISVVVLNIDNHRGTREANAKAALNAIIELAQESEANEETEPRRREHVPRSAVHQEASALLSALAAHEESQMAIASSEAVKALLVRALFRKDSSGRKVVAHLMGLGPRLQWAVSEAVRAHPAKVGELVSRVMTEMSPVPGPTAAAEGEESTLLPEDPDGETAAALLLF